MLCDVESPQRAIMIRASALDILHKTPSSQIPRKETVLPASPEEGAHVCSLRADVKIFLFLSKINTVINKTKH